MASFSTSHCIIAFTFLNLFLKIQALNPVPSFSFTDLGKDPIFKQSVALYGNARVVNGESEVMLSGSGKVMRKNPIKLVDAASKGLVSFSTYFAFSISFNEGGDGLAFVMVPSGSEGEFFGNNSSGFSLGLKGKSGFDVVGIEFSIANRGSASFNVAIKVGDSVPAKKSNVSSVVRSGEKMHAWIDYVASYRRLEVRLNQFGHSRPYDPIIWHSIDFPSVWESKEMFVGFSPVKKHDNINSSQACFLYSWSFVLRIFPHWMHSEPVDPKVLATKETEAPVVKPKSDCLLRILAAMIFGAGCGALTAFVVLYVWTIFGNRRPVMPEEYVMQPMDFEYKKVDVVVDKPIKGAKE
ncbi:L-type lectin-domain containing receptor kinase VIII.2-like [Arachis stenosperma]|uniref:L-type lectin-domain containing receptor kinase VIII.2-like n=1 Tax=Arachis stenosperma TaxID=217475 RepID=UPI0025ABD626|nr:L-type lectin-domain containing receptor kinase VIII.2-like [Arachis stenosperma]